MIKQLLAGAALATLSAGAVNAETLGLMNGRTAVPDLDTGGAAIEATYITGDTSEEGGYTQIAGRLNYQLSPVVTLFADFGQVDFEFDPPFGDFDGNAFGGGLFYYLPEQSVVPSVDVALKASYHTADTEQKSDGQTFEIEFTVINAEVLFSGREPISEAGMRWYASAGAEQRESDTSFNVGGVDPSDKETEAALAAGVTLPFNGGLLYAGLRHVEELTYGAGFRYFFE